MRILWISWSLTILGKAPCTSKKRVAAFHASLILCVTKSIASVVFLPGLPPNWVEGRRLCFFCKVRDVLGAECREDLRDGINEADWAVGLCHVIRGLADFAQNQGGWFQPAGMVDVELDNCPKDIKQVINYFVAAFNQHNVRYQVWSWCLVGAKQVYNLMNTSSREEMDTFYGGRIVDVGGHSRVRRRRKKWFSQCRCFGGVVVCCTGEVVSCSTTGRYTCVGIVGGLIQNIFICNVEVLLRGCL